MLSKLFSAFGGGEKLPTFNATHVVTDPSSKTRDEALQFAARQMFNSGYVSDQHKFYTDLLARENKDSTGFKDHIATPHAKSKQVKNAGIWVIRLTHPVAWETLDDSPVTTIVALSIPNKGDEQVMKPLIAISKANMKAEFRDVLKHGDVDAVAAEVERIIGEGL